MSRHHRLPFIHLSLLLTVLALAAPAALAQHEQETSSSIPALDAFHDVIYPMWHKAYPAKDTKALRGSVTEVEEGAAKIQAVTLPGILRDKDAQWKAALAEFTASAAAYKQAAAGTNDQALLDAAEALHAKYEALVRVVRPPLKEMDEFHQLLYVLYHKQMPGKQYDAVCGGADGMLAKAEAIGTAQLPKRVEAKAEAIKAAAGRLTANVRELADACKAGRRGAAVDAIIDKVHRQYQALEKMFEPEPQK